MIRAKRCPDERSRFEPLSREALADSHKWYSEAYRQDVSKHWHGIQMLALEAALTGRNAIATDLTFVRYVAGNACVQNPQEYWACGTLVESILLAALTPEGFDLAKAKDALSMLRERSAKDAKDEGFAVKSTRRQLQRYVTWWTKENGYFAEVESDMSQYAQALVACLPADVGK
jgi:hypothetical protein